MRAPAYLSRLVRNGSALESLMPLAAQEFPITENNITSAPFNTSSKSPDQLAKIVQKFANTDTWLGRVRLRTSNRWYERLHHSPDYDVWVISWMPGQSTGFHDHGESAGAFIVTTGTLEEHRPGHQTTSIVPGQTRAFGRDYAHDVRNASQAPAISIHAYSPALTEMNEYELDGTQLVPTEHPSQRANSLHQESSSESARQAAPSTIDQLLAASRARLVRLSPHEAHHAATEEDAILVDIRPEAQRATEGTIPGAFIVERNVLEWRLDPTSSARLPLTTSHDLQIIVFCSEGYTSSLAAAALHDVGRWRATDIIGGFQAWQAAGLPSIPPTKAT